MEMRIAATACATAFLALVLGLSSEALAATGVSEERLSLPEGPGSLEGMGENIELNLNMAQMSYGVPIRVPTGFAGMTPAVSLDYGSGSGNSVVGMGWTLSMPSIERLTVRGLPRYGIDDEFSAEGGSELVYVGGNEPRVYRARFESGFVRYAWHDAGTGADGYWTAEHPDGRISYYGADHTGALVSDSRVSGSKGTFRYHLVETTDRYGHLVVYSYDLYGNVTLLNHIGWVHLEGKPQYEVAFEYEDRYEKLSDCKAGFEELLEKRLKKVSVRAHDTLIRQYALEYEGYETSGGFTRLVGVAETGAEGGEFPVHLAFEYSKALGVACTGDCEKPYVVSMGSLGVDIAQGKTTMVDINGDSLPDVLDTTEAGKPHRFFLNELSADGTHKFSSAVESKVGLQGSHAKDSPYVHELDLDGDGFTDLLNAQTGIVLVNHGTGDWVEASSVWQGESGLPDLGAAGTLESVKFMDYDGNKRIDLIFSKDNDQANSTMVFRNDGEAGFNQDENADPVSVGFESKGLELNDMNGDSLLDVVLVNKDSVRYRLNLGWGHWSEWHVVEGFDFTDQEAVQAELEDLNGDGLADLSLVAGNELRYWLNRNGEAFDSEVKVTDADVEGSMPEKTPTTTVLHADMNGNGSIDIVWMQSSGHVSYLEMFPVRPNLLTRVTNGLGRVTDVVYTASVLERARDKGTAAWSHPLPFPMTVVKSTDEWDELSQTHTITEYQYHDGFYDGVEKRFRGYASVEGDLAGDELQEAGRTLEEYDIGATDPYMAGKLLLEEQQSDGKSLTVTTTTYVDCPVEGAPDSGLLFPVRNVCEVREEVQHSEGAADSSEWVTTATEWEHDGYGNIVFEAKLGVTAWGGGACAACEGTSYTGTPCGADCLGDESFKRTTYAVPTDNDDRWILNKPVSVRTFGVANDSGEPAGNQLSETITYYDGPAFEGLPEGQVTHGTPTRAEARKDASGAKVQQVRAKVDGHGNVIESLDPLGTAEGKTHRRLYTMDEEGLKLAEVEILNEDKLGAYSLVQKVKYDPMWGKPIESSGWMKKVDGKLVDAANSAFYTYDEFGRITSIVRPGDSVNKPTEEYEYDLANPVSAVITYKRSKSGGAVDLESVACYDGRGRDVQVRERLSDGKWRVKGFSSFNLHGSTRNSYYPYEGSTGDCTTEAPAGVPEQLYRYDALGRQVEVIFPASGAETGPVSARTELGPMFRLEYDQEDTNPASPHFDTPARVERNGQDQVIRVERVEKPGAAPLVHVIKYDELGRLASVTDPIGATLVQEHDLLGRVVKVLHPDAGTTTHQLDDAGNIVRTEDGRGKVILSQYDGLNRVVAKWDESAPDATRITWIYDRGGDCPAEDCTNPAARTVEVGFMVGERKGTERMGYDPRGNQIWRQVQIGVHTFTSTMQYDNAGRLVSLTHPSGLKIDSVLDGSGSAVEVPGYVQEIGYEPAGMPGSLLGANGVLTERSYDERKRLVGILAQGPEEELVVARTLSLDSLGNVLDVADDLDAGDAPLGNAHYTYDALYRLVKAELEPDRPDYAEVLSYKYDGGDNVLSAASDRGADSPAHVGAMTYGSDAGPHAVTKAGDLTFAYDGAGQMVARGDMSLDWDAFGRLTTAGEGTGTVATFGYGEANDRMLKEEAGHQSLYLAHDFEVRDGTAVSYLMLGEERLVRIEEPSFAATALSDLAPAQGEDDALSGDPDSLITAGDAWLAAAVGAGTLTFAEPVEPDAPELLLHASAQRMLSGTETRVTWLHGNQRGDVVAETNEEGTVVSHSEYYPFGMQRYADGEGDPHGFTGKELDEATGLTFFGARYLDSWTGRWTAPDPAFLVLEQFSETHASEATGAYLFTGDNPTSIVDPDGMQNVPAQALYYANKSAMRRTVAKLVMGQLRPSIGFLSAFGLRPDAPISKKTAWKLVKTAKSIYGRGLAVDAFRPRNEKSSIEEFAGSIAEVLSSKTYQKVAYEQGRNKDLRSFAITGASIGGALDTMHEREIMRFQGLYEGPHKDPNQHWVGDSNVPVNQDWVSLMSQQNTTVGKTSFAPQKKPGLLARIKAVFSRN